MEVGPSMNGGGAEGASVACTSSGRKRKVANYNVEHLSNLVFEQALEEAYELKKKRQRLQVQAAKQAVTKYAPKKKELLPAQIVRPAINFTAMCGYDRLRYAGAQESRTIIDRLYTIKKLKKIGGGFHLYLRCMTDAVLNEICDRIDDQGNHFESPKDMDLYVAQVLRHAWTQLNQWERLKFEMAARREVQKLYRSKQGVAKDDEENIGPEEKSKQADAAARQLQVSRTFPAMPLSEIRFMSEWVKEQKEDELRRLRDKQSRCPFCKDSFLKDDVLQIHILYGHYNMYIYSCHCCFEGFSSLEQLKRHCCQEFAQYMLQLLTKENKFEMKFAMHTLICAECNLQVPLSSVSGESNKRNKLRCLLKYHSLDKLVSCVALFASQPCGIEFVTVKGCLMKYGAPLECKFCSHPFTSANDIEKHQTAEHLSEVTKLKCPVCPRYYVTDLFYRDHLLSHLGETFSMVGVLEKGTFWPPALSSQTVLKMGPSMQKIIGSDVTTRIDKSNDVSDDEDLSYEKSLLKRKDEPGSKKKKLKKCPKEDDQNLCYYCKQVKQLSTRHSSTALCHCAKVPPESPQVAVKNSLVASLVEKFSREARLYVDKKESIHDMTVGAIVDDSVFICVKCNALHLGKESTLKHLRICLQKDAESPDPEKNFDLMDSKIVVCLSPPLCPPNGRICCPECEETCCSIPSLRRHLALVHGIFSYYNAPETHRAVGIMNYVPSAAVLASNTDVAIKTNEVLNLTPTGEFKRDTEKMTQPSAATSSASASSVTSIDSPSVVAAPEPSLQAAPMSVAARSTMVQAFTEPAKTSTAKEKMQCVICCASFSASQHLATHFVRQHLQLCPDCGTAFVEEQRLVSHKSTCQKWPRKCSDGEFFPRCTICSFLLVSPERYFYHLMHCHESAMFIGSKNQQVNPMFIWKKLPTSEATQLKRVSADNPATRPPENVGASMNSIAFDPAPKVTVEGPAVLNKFSCILCELEFSSQAACDLHLQKHPEQWDRCPVCFYYKDFCPITSTQELCTHLLQRHVTKALQPKGVKMVCTLCRSLSSCESTTSLSIRRCEEQMVRHILYLCCGTQVCFICNDGVLYKPEKLKRHRAAEHRVIFERFGCSKCPRKFYTCSSFRKHSCNVLLKCSCGIQTFFMEQEFEMHFKEHLNSMSDFCLLCNKYLFSKDQLAQHILTHRITVNGKRQLTQLNPIDTSIEGVQPVPTVSNSVTPGMVNGKEQSKQDKDAVSATFQYRSVKTNNDDDEIMFLGFGDKTSKHNKPATTANETPCITETVPNNFLTNVRSEAEPAATVATPICVHPAEPAPTFTIPIEADEDAVVDIVNRILRTVVSPETNYISDDGPPVPEPEVVNTLMDSTNSVQERNTTTEGAVSESVHPEIVKHVDEGASLTKANDTSKADSDSDDLLIIDEGQNVQSEAGVEKDGHLKAKETDDKEVIDSELEVVKAIEGQIESMKIQKRQPKFRCNQCTERFLTRASLKAHMETHRYDAGQTIEAVYGVPIDATVYLCRLCCLAYESKAIYQKHVRTHGVLQNCEQCSVVAFNEDQMKAHRAQHLITPERNQRLIYVCSKCIAAYSTEERLYHHMFTVHSQAVLYFCKHCCLGNTNGRVVYEHITRNECFWKKQRQTADCPNMGFTAACLFHYQPSIVGEYELKVRTSSLFVVIPSECIHRSFLSQGQDLVCITCPICSSLMNFTRLQAENPKFVAAMPHTLSPAADDNDAIMMHMLNTWKAAIPIRQRNASFSAGIQQQPPSLASISSPSSYTSSHLHLPSSVSLVSAAAAASGVPFSGASFDPMPPLTVPLPAIPIPQSAPRVSPRVSMPSLFRPDPQLTLPSPAITATSPAASTPNLPRQANSDRQSQAILPDDLVAALVSHTNPSSRTSTASPSTSAVTTRSSAPAITAQPNTSVSSATFSSKSPPYMMPYRGALEAVDLITVGTQMVTRDYILKNAEGRFFCARTECANIRIEKMTSGRVHNLRHNPQNIFFCLECGSAFPFENLIVKHMIEYHHQKQVPAMSLRCPLCPERVVFAQVEQFRKHMATEEIPAHSNGIHTFVFKQRCKLHFYSVEARLRHDQEHRASRNAPCCIVCGTSRNWWFHAARPDSPYLDHSFIHAFSLWGMCRECGLCHPNELKVHYFLYFDFRGMFRSERCIFS